MLSKETDILTYRQSVIGKLLEYFDSWGVNTSQFQAATFDAIDKLNNYEEEGQRLSPHVFLLDDRDFNTCAANVAFNRLMPLWEGDSFEGIGTWAIKKFAPLCIGHWKLYISLGEEKSRVGLFGASPVVTGIREIEPFSGIRGIAIRCLADSVVEIDPGDGKKLEIHFTLRKDSEKPIFHSADSFVNAIVRQLDSSTEFFQLTKDIVEKIVFEAIHERHGFLTAIVPDKKSFDNMKFKDVLRLKNVIDLAKSCEAYKKDSSASAYYDLVAIKQVVHGMMMSDGITFFSSDAQVLGFNGFVPVTGNKKATGGARRRAYNALTEMVDNGTVLGVCIQSQDGRSDWYEK